MIGHVRITRSPGIRVQLTLLYTAIFALLILLFSIVLYSTLQAFLASGVDSALQLQAQQIADGISIDRGKINIQDVTGDLPGLDATATPGAQSTVATQQTSDIHSIEQPAAQSDVNIGILVRILNVKALIAYTSPAFGFLVVPSVSVTQPLHGIPWQGTVLAQNGQAVRLYSIPLIDNETVFGVLQVGESLAQLTATLQSMIIALLIVAPFVLLLSACGSYWLAKRAFRAIHHLTRTARNIKAGDLHQRVPVPRAQDEVHDLALTFNEMIERLERAFAQQRRFVADASHELRTPVTVIRTIAEVTLKEPFKPEECAEVLQDINAEAERLGQLINDLLLLARADEEQLSLDHDLVRLDQLASDVAAAMEPMAVERNIDLHVQQLESVTVLGDTARLIQIMMGLVDNAITYTNARGIIVLNVNVDSMYACFSVSDTGIGIAPEDIPHIFERFYRADPARSRAAGGTGLGLAIVDWLVSAHHGSVTVDSHVGQGSTFTVKLPLAS